MKYRTFRRKGEFDMRLFKPKKTMITIPMNNVKRTEEADPSLFTKKDQPPRNNLK